MTQWQFGNVYEIHEYFDRLVMFYEGNARFEINHNTKQILHPKHIKFQPVTIIDRKIGYMPPDAHIKGESAIIMPINENTTKKIYNFIQMWIKTRQNQIKKESK